MSNEVPLSISSSVKDLSSMKEIEQELDVR